MRITGGNFGGRKILVPNQDISGFRPTTDFIRKSLFSSLSSHLDFEGLSVLDLFSGTGAMGIESLSRGALNVTFVEKDPLCCKAIRRNVDVLVLSEGRISILNKPFEKVDFENKQYDLVIADPPYGTINVFDLIKQLHEGNIFHKDSFFVFEDRAQVLKSQVEQFDSSSWCGFELLKFKSHGESSYAIFRKNN